MISIDGIEGPPYRFPTIDFKFQNTGALTAFLTQFKILIEAEIDTKPELKFGFTAHAKDGQRLYLDKKKRDQLDESAETSLLTFSCSNVGWGLALKCEIVPKILSKVDNSDILSRIIPVEKLVFRGTIDSGDSVDILSLSSDDIDEDRFHALMNSAMQKIRRHPPGNRRTFGLQSDSIRLECRYRDQQGSSAGRTLYPENPNGVFINAYAFREISRLGAMAASRPSDMTYCVIVDPSDSHIERDYKISRSVPAGDIDRFHIMIGATKSCLLHTRFLFKVDAGRTVESELFSIQIWNPRDRRWHERYEDADEINRILRRKES